MTNAKLEAVSCRARRRWTTSATATRVAIDAPAPKRAIKTTLRSSCVTLLVLSASKSFSVAIIAATMARIPSMAALPSACTHLYGDDVFRNGAFDQARRIVLDDRETNDAAIICQMMPGFTADFPRAPVDAHQMMLDEYNGVLCFRMRLYNSFGYSVSLAPMNDAWRVMMGPTLPKRVVVEFQTSGIKEVPDWK
jgi:hypothetical protein